MSRQPSVDARLTPPKALQDAPGPTISRETVPHHPPADPEIERWRRVLREYEDRGKPQPQMIPTAEAQYRRIMNPGWIDIAEAAREEMERRKAQESLWGTPGSEFDF
jgi:hypothetical protein